VREALVLGFASGGAFFGRRRTAREIPENRRAMSGLVRACEIALLDAGCSRYAAAGARLYIRMPVSMAFALGYQLRTDAFALYYETSPHAGFVRLRQS
jgi:hypothetical protein